MEIDKAHGVRGIFAVVSKIVAFCFIIKFYMKCLDIEKQKQIAKDNLKQKN